jgi:uncharacterized SAM-binding protein YcdF (DUF218 family)
MDRRVLLGCFNRKERWGLSARGLGIASMLLVVVTITSMLSIFPFLAVTNRVDADFLVIEGWIPEYAARVAAKEFLEGGYNSVISTGGPVSGTGGYINDYQTSASVGAGRLKAAGVPGELVQMVPSRVMNRDRTYASGVALRTWLDNHGIQPKGVNIVTEGPHARRTRLLFQKALGNKVKVGIIAVRSPDYDSTRWWLYSESIREVCSEAIAYLYARCFN